MHILRNRAEYYLVLIADKARLGRIIVLLFNTFSSSTFFRTKKKKEKEKNGCLINTSQASQKLSHQVNILNHTA